MKKIYKVQGMSCSACAANIENALKKNENIKDISVNILTNSLEIDFNQKKFTEKELESIINSLGYKLVLKNKTNEKQNNDFYEIMICAILTFIIMYLSMGHMIHLYIIDFFDIIKNPIGSAFTQFLLVLPIIYFNRHFFINGTKALLKLNPNMDSLIAIGSFFSIFYGIFSIYKIGYILNQNGNNVMYYSMRLYFEAGAMILTLIRIGKYLETRAKRKTSSAIEKLMEMTPETSTLLIEGQEVKVNTFDIKVGDVIVLKSGDKVPVDGKIIKGNCYVDQSHITGEPISVFKEEESEIISASIIKSGYCLIEAVRVGEDSTLQKIIKMIENAANKKPKIAKLADKICFIFVPTVILISIFSFLYWYITTKNIEISFTCAVSTLVISCPCALGLATPTSIMVGTGKGAQNGILIKSGEILENAYKIDTVVLDKTGTITEGSPTVSDIICFNQDFSKEEILKISASLETKSNHPLASAIIKKSQNNKVKLYETDEFENFDGKGISAKILNKKYFIGNFDILKQNNLLNDELIKKQEDFTKNGKTAVYLADEKNIIGAILIFDEVRKTSKKAIENLKRLNIDIYMLTGDNINTATTVANQIGIDIDKVIAEVKPEEKQDCIINLRKKSKNVMMVGDGINDSPSLAAANVGVSLGKASDIAIESADIVLSNSDLNDISNAILLSKKVILNIKENLFLAFIYNIICIPLAAGVWVFITGETLDPMFAAFAMSLSSISVILNSLRLKFFSKI